MAASPLSKLHQVNRQELLDDLNCLNIAEIKSWCRKHSIPFTIAVETGDGRRRRTKEDDRKGVILGRIPHFLQTGAISEETLGLSPRLRQTVKTLLTVRCKFIVPDPGTDLGWACR